MVAGATCTLTLGHRGPHRHEENPRTGFLYGSACGEPLARTSGKRCVKCGRPIRRPFLADDEDERCARCGDS